MVPCGWEVIGCDSCAALSSLDDDVREAIEERAITRLWEWTNRRFGNCPVIYRPCSQACGTCGCYCRCRCCEANEIILPGPVFEPIEILVDGEPLDLSMVRVDNYNRLVRMDGERWPSCQNLSAEGGYDENTFQITYIQGEEVPPGGALVAGILASEYAKAMCSDDSCRLPKRVSTVSRQGMTIAMLDDFTKLAVGFTGIWEIDDWIATYQTNLRSGPWRQGTVSSPDIPMQRFTTWSYDAVS